MVTRERSLLQYKRERELIYTVVLELSRFHLNGKRGYNLGGTLVETGKRERTWGIN